MLELTNDNQRGRRPDRALLPERAKELFMFAQGDTYMSQMRQWAEIVRDSVRQGQSEPEAPTFADGLACARVMDRLKRRALSAADHRDEEPT